MISVSNTTIYLLLLQKDFISRAFSFFIWKITVINGYCQNQPSEVFCKKYVLNDFSNFRRKHLCWSLFLIKLEAFIKKELQHRPFSVKLATFLRTTYFGEHLRTTASTLSFKQPWGTRRNLDKFCVCLLVVMFQFRKG